MFNIAKFEFSTETFNHTLRINVIENEKTDIKVYLDIEDSSKKLIVCTLDSASTNEELLKAGESLSKEISEDFNFELNDQFGINLKLVIENILVGLTPTNLYSKEFEMAKTYKVNGAYEVEAAYIDAAVNAASYNVTRILNHLPYNECNPETMVGIVSKLFVSPDVNITILRKAECEALNLQGMLTLSKGSRFEPTLIKLEYKTSESLPKLALVGKGVMFDTGGYSIKTGRDISNMKADMGGASAVLGTIHHLANTHAKANVTAYLMLTDNLINEQAMIPGDVITYSNGLSVEVANTDAEGRLILADGILLAQSEGAEKIIDIATLTGNAVAALGPEYAAVYSNTDQFALDIASVNSLSNDKVWHMPLIKDYKSSLKGNISDLRNISSMPYAGSITAALFLEHFVSNVEWAHIDMAAQTERSEFGTKYSGYGVRLLSNYIRNN